MRVVSIRLEDDLLARVDARGEGRSEFIRSAIEAALSKKRSGADRKPKPAELSADARVLLVHVGKGSCRARDAADELGLKGLRYDKAERALLDAGLVRVSGGTIEAVEK